MQVLSKKVYALFPILEERKKQTATTLSGGEQQVLAIGRALMSQPKVLILDEPFQGLAPVVIESIMETLRRLNRKGLAILLIEQNAEHAFRLATRGYVLETGHLTLSGTVEDLENNEYLRKEYLGL